MRKGNLFVISGPSGAGKGTLVEKLPQEVDDIWVSISATTRDPRDGELDGKDYFFKTKEEFMSMIDNGELLEWACYSDNYYGTPYSTIEKRVEDGFQVVLEIEVQGALLVREKLPNAILIFIEPPSLEELERRLRVRGTESEDEIRKRLKTAEVELSRKMDYDISFVNDNLETTLHELSSYINEKANNL